MVFLSLVDSHLKFKSIKIPQFWIYHIWCVLLTLTKKIMHVSKILPSFELLKTIHKMNNKIPQPFDLNRSTSTVRPQPFDLNRSTSTVRPVFIYLLIGISTKTFWADVSFCAIYSKIVDKPPNTEGVLS
jgi:hypothetical protein